MSKIYRPGPFTSRDRPQALQTAHQGFANPSHHHVPSSHGSSGSSHPTVELREMRAENEMLRKELVRKETRNENMIKELNTLRENFSNQQRELRILSGTFEKVNVERVKLLSELTRATEHADRLELQMHRLQDAALTAQHVDRLQATIVNLQAELESSRNVIMNRDDRIKTLEREMDVLQRTIGIQREYEGGDRRFHSGASCGGACSGGMGCVCGGTKGGSREVLRSLYYELGKRQVDAHELTLSLAESHREMELLREELDREKMTKESLENELARLVSHCDAIVQQSQHDNDELVQIQEESSQLKEINDKLQEQLEELSTRYQESKSAAESEIYSKNRTIGELSEALPIARQEAEAYKARVETLLASISQLDSVNKMCEQKIIAEREKTSAEREIFNSEKALMLDKIKRAEAAQTQVELMRKSLADALSAKEEEMRKYQALLAEVDNRNTEESQQIAALKMRLQETEMFLQSSQAHENRLTTERDEAMKALMQTVEATRELSDKYQKERGKRIAAEERAILAEKVVDSLRRAKEHVSTAVLDALHKERSKNMSLEQALNAMSIDQRQSNLMSNIPIPQSTEAPSSSSSSSSSASRYPPQPPSSQTPEPRQPLSKYNSSSYHRSGSEIPSKTLGGGVSVDGMVGELKKLQNELKNMEDAAPSPLSSSTYSYPAFRTEAYSFSSASTGGMSSSSSQD